MFLLGVIVALGGMLCLAATQSKQAKLLFNRAPDDTRRRLGRWAGTALLIASAAQAVAVYGLGVGLVTFLAWACLGGWLVALVLTWRRSRG